MEWLRDATNALKQEDSRLNKRLNNSFLNYNNCFFLNSRYLFMGHTVYHFEAMKMTAKIHTECLLFVLSIQNFTMLVTSILWPQSSIDKAVSQNKC